jgi:hypothetical protein
MTRILADLCHCCEAAGQRRGLGFGTDRVKRRRISVMADDMRQLRAEQVRILALSQAIRGRRLEELEESVCPGDVPTPPPGPPVRQSPGPARR